MACPIERAHVRLEEVCDGESVVDGFPYRAAAWVAGGAGVLWACARAVRRESARRYGRPARREFDAAQVPSNAVDVGVITDSGATLHGWLREPVSCPESESGLPRPVALVIHGWGASAADMVPLSEPLLEAGLCVLLLDARGHGRSGEVGVATMPTFAEDLRSALHWLRSHPQIDSDRIVLVGHSVGAGAALFVAADDHTIAGVVSISSMAAPRDFMAERMRSRFPSVLVRLALRYVEHVIGHRFIEFSPLDTIGRSTAPILLIHGAQDGTVPLADAQRLHAQSPDRSTLLILPQAGHADFGAIQEATPSLLRFLLEAGVVSGRATAGQGALAGPAE